MLRSWNFCKVTVRSEADAKSVMCSLVSTALILATGVEVLIVDFSGRARFRPQSPRPRAEGVVVIACCIGYGSVAESDMRLDWTWPMRSLSGRGSGGGSEKRREFRKSVAVGDDTLLDILTPAS